MSIKDRLNQIKNQITASCQLYGRNPQDVLLLVVSKNRTISEIIAAVEAGQKDFGENYAQEALKKIQGLKHLHLTWHFIGAIQSNKTKVIAENFDWVHSVDRIKIAEKLNHYRPLNKSPLNVCVEVNISCEKHKSGVLKDEAFSLVNQIMQLPRLRCRGLMVIPQLTEDTKLQHEVFAEIAELKRQLNKAGLVLDTLSMGMSNDFTVAIAEGATIVRIGTAIFGPRKP